MLGLATACSALAVPAVEEQVAGAAPQTEVAAPIASEPPVTSAPTVESEPPVLIDRSAAGPIAPPVLPVGLHWSPAQPEEGSAFSILALEPNGGVGVVSIDAHLGGRPIYFEKLSSSWLAVGAIAVGASGTEELTLTIRYVDGSERRRQVAIEPVSREWASTQLHVAPRFSSPPPETQARIERETATVRNLLAEASPEWILNGGFQEPRPIHVTSPFGQRRLFNGDLRSRHWGLDLAGRQGEPVRAAARGRVRLARNLYFAGNAVYIDHGRGVFTGYFHLSRIRVSEGELVERGQLIGDVGDTGRVTAAHLHWSAYVGGTPVDAASLLQIPIPE